MKNGIAQKQLSNYLEIEEELHETEKGSSEHNCFGKLVLAGPKTSILLHTKVKPDFIAHNVLKRQNKNNRVFIKILGGNYIVTFPGS